MTFRKTARVEHLGSLVVDGDSMQRLASSVDSAQTSYYLDGTAKVDVRGILGRVAKTYAISEDPGDYVFEAIRANTTSVFNDNHDGFRRSELLRFDPRLKTAVYLTYREKPHHVNHRTANSKRARGVILDAHYNGDSTPLEQCVGCGHRVANRKERDPSGIFCKKCGTVVNDEFVEILVAVDGKKDPLFARGVREGQLRFGSMGCTCAETICNVCNNVARSRGEFCKHIASHKGSLWAQERPDGSWTKIHPKTAQAEMAKRGRKLHLPDFVALRADDGYQIRKAAEWCQGVEFDEFSRVHMPADVKAEQTEILNRRASSDDPTPDNLRSETSHLVASVRQRRKKASEETSMNKFVLVRVDGDDADTYAAETLDKALALAGADEGSMVEYAEVEADDAGAARLMAEDVEFKPVHDASVHEVDGDVTVNIQEDPLGDEEEVSVEPDTPQSIEDFTETELDPEPMSVEEDEEFSPEELGVMPAGASKEAATMHTTFSDWKVQVSKRGNAQVVSPNGPVMIIKAEKDDDEEHTDEERVAFGRKVMSHLMTHGLYDTATTFDGAFHSKFAQVVEHAVDDMKEFADKDTKENVATGGETDMSAPGTGADRGTHVDDVRDDDVTDMQPGREVHVEQITEDRVSDNELQNTDEHPDSATESQDSDMREKRREFNVGKDDALTDAIFDHTERLAMVGKWVEDKTGRQAKVASYNKAAQQFTLVDPKLTPTEVKAADLISQWKQLDKGPEDQRSRVAKLESRMRAWAQKEIAKARKQAVAEVFRALRIAGQRQAKGLTQSPLKVAMATELANNKVVGHDAVSHAPLEYRGMADELAIHLVEAAYAEAAANEVDGLIKSASELMAHDTKYLASAESDLEKVAYRVPVVTAATMVDDLDREAEGLRRQAAAGNLNLASSPTNREAPISEQRSAYSNGHASKIRDALGATRAAARTQFRH